MEAYIEYVDGRYNQLTNLVVVIIGFCLGTLSATKVPALWNFILLLIVMVVSFFLILSEKGGPGSKLTIVITELEDKYKHKKNSKENLKEIHSYNIWDSFSKRAVKNTLPLAFASLFGIYTLFYHALEFNGYW